MKTAELAIAIAHLPKGIQLTLSVGQLRDLLVGVGGQSDALTAEEVGALPAIRRSPATVRRYANSGRFPGAYKLPNGEWRFPRASVVKFLDALRVGGTCSEHVRAPDAAQGNRPRDPTPRPSVPVEGKALNLDDWRRVRDASEGR